MKHLFKFLLFLIVVNSFGQTKISDGTLKASVTGAEKIPVSGINHPVINGNLLHTYHKARFDSIYQAIFTTLGVNKGGTGRATLTAYAPLFGGTTTTGAVQSGTVGTPGQVLTSNGAGALPTFQAAGGGGTVATFSEALAGTNDAKFMSPLKNRYVSSRVYNVEAYGAVHDGIIIPANVTTVASSATITISGGATPFLSGDVGKVILISGAGVAGAPLRTTIATYISSTSVTTTVAPSTSTTLSWMIFGTDDTAAIQSAINAVHLAGGGTVYAPTGIYIINGALQTSISGTNPNSQIYFPSEADNSFTFSPIKLLGEGATALDGYNGGTLLTGTVLVSTLITGSGINPSVFGTKGTTGNFQNFNYSDIVSENVHLIITTNKGAHAPYISGWNLFQAAQVSMKRVSVTTEVGLNFTFNAVGTDTFGFALSSYNNNGPNTFSECSVGGFKYGAIIGEHSIVDNFYAIGDYFGFVLMRGYHTITGKILTHQCNTQIYVPSAGTFLGQDNSAANSVAMMDLILETEINVTGKWFDTATLLDDFGAYSGGRLRLATGSGTLDYATANNTMLATILNPSSLRVNIIPSQSTIPRRVSTEGGGVITTPGYSTTANAANAVFEINSTSIAAGTIDGDAVLIQTASQSNTSTAPIGRQVVLNTAATGANKTMWFEGVYTDGANNTAVKLIRANNAGTVTSISEQRPTGITHLVPLTVTAGIVGVSDNSAATAGNVGEQLISTVSSYTNYTSTATYQNIASITLTAGDWDLSAFITYNSNAATITAASNAIFVISTTTASASGATEGLNIGYIPQAALLGTSKFTDTIAPYRVSLSGTTTYYLNSQATFTVGNPQYVGTIRARRIR